MAWYYKEGDNAVGPLDKPQLQELIKAKKVTAQTLIRDEKSDQWRPLGEMVRRKPKAPGPATQAQTPPPSPPGQVTVPQSPQTPPSAVCSQCGRSFPQDQVIHFEGQTICAACKPLFVQKIREGADLPTTFHYAGFWIRLGAKTIDAIILMVLQWAVMLPLSLLGLSGAASSPGTDASLGSIMGTVGMSMTVGLLIPAIYYTCFIGRFSATLGKMVCRIKIVAPSGEPISYLRAFGRFWAEFVSSMILAIGYLMAAFDSQKRALHDRICSTRVIYK